LITALLGLRDNPIEGLDDCTPDIDDDLVE
jgi:hypothetical protein